MKTNRRKFLSLLGVGAASAPLAAKAAGDAQFAKDMGLHNFAGLGSATMGLSSGGPPAECNPGPYIPYEKRLMGAADYIKIFGVPSSVEFRMRDEAKYVAHLDPDIACKQSWSMSVKIMTQRERNYQRSIERMRVAGWQERGRQSLKDLLGFDWPW